MQSLNPKSNLVVASFESDSDVIRVVRLQKFWVSRMPLPNFVAKGSVQSVYPIACNPQWDVRTQSMMFERALINLGYTSKDIRKNVMIQGMAPRFIVASANPGMVLYNIDKGLLVIDMSVTHLDDKWTP